MIHQKATKYNKSISRPRWKDIFCKSRKQQKKINPERIQFFYKIKDSFGHIIFLKILL
ncbi:MAG: LlaJI family restriction endonuclease [Leptonema sp. (in: bacteria)]